MKSLVSETGLSFAWNSKSDKTGQHYKMFFELFVVPELAAFYWVHKERGVHVMLHKLPCGRDEMLKTLSPYFDCIMEFAVI